MYGHSGAKGSAEAKSREVAGSVLAGLAFGAAAAGLAGVGPSPGAIVLLAAGMMLPVVGFAVLRRAEAPVPVRHRSRVSRR